MVFPVCLGCLFSISADFSPDDSGHCTFPDLSCNNVWGASDISLFHPSARHFSFVFAQTVRLQDQQNRGETQKKPGVLRAEEWPTRTILGETWFCDKISSPCSAEIDNSFLFPLLYADLLARSGGGLQPNAAVRHRAQTTAYAAQKGHKRPVLLLKMHNFCLPGTSLSCRQ